MNGGKSHSVHCASRNMIYETPYPVIRGGLERGDEIIFTEIR